MSPITNDSFEKVKVYYTEKAAGGDVDYFNNVNSAGFSEEGGMFRLAVGNEIIIIPMHAILKVELLLPKEERDVDLD